MTKISTLLLSGLLLAPLSVAHADGLTVYPPVRDADGSTHCESRQYKVRVREDRPGSPWKDVYAMRTVCKTAKPGEGSKGYFAHLAGWSHTYVNFESTTDVVVEISDAVGYKIATAAVHPKAKGSASVDKFGRAYVKLKKDSLVAVDIDGRMDNQDTGVGYKGEPIHTISIFANPPLVGKPAAVGGTGVRYVKPGQKPDLSGDWTTLYFLPGVHDIGLAFPLRADRNYYIPGDAVVYGTFNSDPRTGAKKKEDEKNAITKEAACSNIRIFGHGTLSGARLTHPMYIPGVSRDDDNLYNPIRVDRPSNKQGGAAKVDVEGITVVDSANHSVQIRNYKREARSECSVRWTKVFTWRENGDGIGPWANTKVEDCFIRTQDDSMYVAGLGISRCVLWNDANGSSFMMAKLPDFENEGAVLVEGCDVIYSRRAIYGPGGRVFSIRGDGDAGAKASVTFRNINIEDPRPTFQQFFLCMEVPQKYSSTVRKSKPGDLSGIVFENVTIAGPSVLGEPQLLWGHADSVINNLTFKNVTVVDDPKKKTPPRTMKQSDFETNEFVVPLKFIK